MPFQMPLSHRQRASEDFTNMSEGLVRALQTIRQAKLDAQDKADKDLTRANMVTQGARDTLALGQERAAVDATRAYTDSFSQPQAIPDPTSPVAQQQIMAPDVPQVQSNKGDMFKAQLAAKMMTARGQPISPEEWLQKNQASKLQTQQTMEEYPLRKRALIANTANTEADTALKGAQAKPKPEEDNWIPVETTTGIYKMNKKTGDLVPATDAGGKPLSGAGKNVRPQKEQFDAAGFGRRMEQANGVFDGLVAGGYARESAEGGLNAVAPNKMKSSPAQQQDQAERNFVNATLRRESGAAISPAEFSNAEKQYFPRFGDNKEVLAQKAANRAQVMETMKASAGGAWDMVPQITVKPVGGQDKKALALQALNDPQATAEEKQKANEILSGHLGLAGN